ncbi:hypothetical protein M0R45_031019 [Rubus argutus]|uniref:Uncharacterized protein n=1 Tax=Rubus argutus TaxID=59490 RepID=A0AAW1WG00_RUBAR
MEGVQSLLKFIFEHLVGRCKKSFLISHIGEQCSLASDDVPSEGSARVKLSGFGSVDLVPSSCFVFTSQPPRPIGSSLFKNVSSFPLLEKEHRPIVIRDLGLVSNSQDGKNDDSAGVERDKIECVLGKLSRAVGIGSSPKKLKLDWAIRRPTTTITINVHSELNQAITDHGLLCTAEPNHHCLAAVHLRLQFRRQSLCRSQSLLPGVIPNSFCPAANHSRPLGRTTAATFTAVEPCFFHGVAPVSA